MTRPFNLRAAGLAALALLLAACVGPLASGSGGGATGGDESIPTIEFEADYATPTPQPTAVSYFVIGKATIDYWHLSNFTFPTGTQLFEEQAKIPIEIIRRPEAPAGQYEVTGDGVLTWLLDVSVPGSTGCVAKFATTAQVTVSGNFYPDPRCELDITLTLNFQQPQMVNGSGICEAPTMDPATYHVNLVSGLVKDGQMRASYLDFNGTFQEERIVLRDPEVDFDETGCLVGEAVQSSG